MELPKIMRRRLPLPCLLLAALAVGSFAQAAEKRAWPEILKVVVGQAVYWNAWGGDARVNAYIASVGDQVKERYRITPHLVKLADNADADYSDVAVSSEENTSPLQSLMLKS